MKHKVIAAIVSFALLIPLNATAAIKAGAACKKVGQTQSIAGAKYTCTKSGNKLIWKKTVVKPKPAPSGTPSPTTKPSPSPTSTPSTQVALPNSAIIEKLDVIVADALKIAKPVSAQIDFQIGPGVESAQLGAIAKESINSALIMASLLNVSFSVPMKVYIGNRDWLAPKMPAGTWCADPVIGVPGTASAGYCGKDTGVIFLNVDGYLEDSGRKISRDFTKNPDRFLISFSFVHEIIHWMQEEAVYKYAKTKGFYNPFWLNEGGANFASMVAHAYMYKTSFSKIRVFIATYSSCVTKSSSIYLRDSIKNGGQSGNCGPYYGGYLWSEYLVASTGKISALVDLAKQSEKVSNELIWDPAKEAEFLENKLALSLKYEYGFDFADFTAKAEAHSNSSSQQLAAWLQAQQSIYPETP